MITIKKSFENFIIGRVKFLGLRMAIVDIVKIDSLHPSEEF